MWTAFAASSGGAAGGFAALAFIVVAIRYDLVTTSSEIRARAGQSLTSVLTVLASSLLINVPQSLDALGSQLIIVSLLGGAMFAALETVGSRAPAPAPSRALLCLTRAALLVISLLELASGIVLVTIGTRGLYVFAAAAIIALLWTAYGTWGIVTSASATTENTAESATH